MGFYLIYSGHKYNCGLKIANQWDKRHNNITFTWKKVKFGLILVRTETDATTHTCKFLSRNKNKKLNIGISIFFFCKFLQYKGLSQNVDLIQHEIGLA